MPNSTKQEMAIFRNKIKRLGAELGGEDALWASQALGPKRNAGS